MVATLSADADLRTEETKENSAEMSQSTDGGDHADSIQSAENADFGYNIDIDSFSGPLDLLLHLVRRSELDITEISIVEIADHFLDTITSWEDADLELAGDFILMAATLLEMKSRTIAPAEETETDEDEDDFIDARTDLIRQLLAYRSCKEAALELDELQEQRGQVYKRRFQEDIPEDEDAANGFDIENADMYQLFNVWDGILSSIAGNSPRTVVYDDIPIEERVRSIVRTMKEAGEGQFSWLLTTVQTRIQRVGVVVALLECIRSRAVEAIQHEQYSDIYLRYRGDEDKPIEHGENLPPEIEPEVILDKNGKPKKRRRRGPIVLMTWQPKQQEVAESEGSAEAQEETMVEEIIEDVVVETDDDRFIRTLNEQTSVDNILDVVKNLDENIKEHLIEEGIMERPLEAVVGNNLIEPQALALETRTETEIAEEQTNRAIEDVPAVEQKVVQENNTEEDDEDFGDFEDEFDDDDEDDEFDNDDE